MKKYIKQYREEGFCVVPGLLAGRSCKRVLKEMNSVVSSQLEVLGLGAMEFEGDESLHANMQTLFHANTDIYLASVRHLGRLLSVQQLLADENILALTNRLGISLPSLPTGPVVSIMSDRLRVQGGYFGLAPHQDWPSMQGSLDAVVVWAPLTNVTVEKFPLQLIPQSHLKGMWEGENTAYERQIRSDLMRDEDFVSVEVRRGDVVFMTAFTVHRTGVTHQGQDCNGLRIACNSRLENSAEATFVDRHFPCAYKRTVERDLITKDFPSSWQVIEAIQGGRVYDASRQCG